MCKIEIQTNAHPIRTGERDRDGDTNKHGSGYRGNERGYLMGMRLEKSREVRL